MDEGFSNFFKTSRPLICSVIAIVSSCTTLCGFLMPVCLCGIAQLFPLIVVLWSDVLGSVQCWEDPLPRSASS